MGIHPHPSANFTYILYILHSCIWLNLAGSFGCWSWSKFSLAGAGGGAKIQIKSNQITFLPHRSSGIRSKEVKKQRSKKAKKRDIRLSPGAGGRYGTVSSI